MIHLCHSSPLRTARCMADLTRTFSELSTNPHHHVPVGCSGLYVAMARVIRGKDVTCAIPEA